MIAAATELDALIDKGHTGTFIVEINLLNGSIIKAKAKHDTVIFSQEKRK